MWTPPEAHTEPKQTSWVCDVRCFRDLLVFHEPLGIRVLLRVNIFSYKTLKSHWYWIYSHWWLWNPIDIEYILIDDFEILTRVILFSYITLKCCWEWIYPHIWLWNPVESDYIIMYDFEILLRVNIFYYMTLKSCWEWLYSHIWLYRNDVESEYILIYYFEMLGAISPGANQFSVVHQCIQAGQVSFWHRFQPQFNSEKVVKHKNLSHFTLEKKVIQSNSFCEIDLRRIWARRRLIVFVGVRSDW